MYNEHKDGFQVNNFLKGTSGQKMVAISFTGCRFLLMRKVKPELRDMVQDGFFCPSHVQIGTGPEREKLLSGLSKAC